MRAADLLIDCGFTKPITQITAKDVQEVVDTISVHCTILKIKAELDQIRCGLEEAEMLESIEKWPELFKPFFVASPNNIPTSSNANYMILLLHLF